MLVLFGRIIRGRLWLNCELTGGLALHSLGGAGGK